MLKASVVVWSGILLFLNRMATLAASNSPQQAQISLIDQGKITDSPTTLLSSSHVRSLIECGRECLRHQSCMSYFYRTGDGLCQLHSIFFVKRDDWISSLGTKYYILSQGKYMVIWLNGNFLEKMTIFGNFFEKKVKFLAIFFSHSNGNFPGGQMVI